MSRKAIKAVCGLAALFLLEIPAAQILNAFDNAAGCFCFLSQPAFAEPSADELLSAIKDSKELSEDRKFTCLAKDGEARISTFALSDVENDCKIDAVLFARVITQKFPEINRVVVDFHKQNADKKYKQVTVTRPELVAFGSGKVSSGELLDAIRIDEKLELVAVQKEKGPEEKKSELQAANSKAAEAYKVAVDKGENPEAKWETYHAPGLAFDYPVVWRKYNEYQGELVVKFTSSQTTYNEAALLLKLFRSPEKTPVIDEARKRCGFHQKEKNFRVLKPSGIATIGRDRNIKAVYEYFSHTNKQGKTLYERRYYFGWPGYVYCLGCWATPNDFKHVNGLFDHLLNTVKIEASGNMAKSGK